MDSTRFPMTAAYVASLPQQLRSYPECQVKTEGTRVMFETHPNVLDDVDAESRELLEGARLKEWTPECVAVALRLLIRERYHPDDESFIRWNHAIFAKVFASGMNRVLMYVLSPSLAFMGAARRWSAFRRGTSLEAAGVKGNATLRLRYPPYLFPPLIARALSESFRAGLHAAGAKDIGIEMIDYTTTTANFSVRWE